jgi:phosphoribosylamine---glycine ligase
VKISEGTLTLQDVTFEQNATVCKYIVPAGYPDAPHPGDPVTIKPPDGALVYYANVEEHEGRLSTLSSRTLAFVGVGPTLEKAERIAEQAASAVTGNVRYRRDIGTRALLEQRMRHMKELR